MKRYVSLVLVVLSLMVQMGYANKNYSGRARPDQLMMHITPCVSLLNYKSVDGRSMPSGNLGAGIELAHFFGLHLGFSVGAEVSSFSTFYKFNGRKDSLQLFDNYSGRYYRLRQKLTTNEYQNVTYLSLPVKLHYRCELTKKLNFNVSIGAAYTKYLSESKSIVSGTIDRQAYFQDIHVTIDEFYPLGFGKFNDYIHPSSTSQFKGTILGIAQVGFTFNLAPNWNMHTELNFQYGLKNIKTRSIPLLVPEEYSGITATNYIGEIHPASLGLRIGVAYNFDIFNVDCKCHSKWD